MRTLCLISLPLFAAACGDTSMMMTGSDASVPADLTMSASPDLTMQSGGLSITTGSGVVNGKTEGTTRAFLGIPYAAPPVGDLRWKPPQAPAPWATPRDATKVGPGCPQIQPFTNTYDDTSNEDCLTLNVWTPSTASQLPVMFFIHGGSFTSGSGGLPLYDGEKLSEAGNTVVVTINYRLGPLGFMGHSALTAEDPNYKSSGNYGFEDQLAALKWVKSNIAAFGGDPAHVTIFGESAGAQSVFAHLTSPKSTGLFARALAESGYYLIYPTQSQAETQGATVATAAGCTDADPVKAIACMRGKTAKEVINAMPPVGVGFGGITWGPVIDNLDITDSAILLLEKGNFQHVPFLLGTNGNEGTIFLYSVNVASDADNKAFLTPLVGDILAGNVVAEYPTSSYPSAKDALADALGDGLFVCPTRRIARASVTAGDPTYLYHFTHAINFILPNLGAFHSAELPFVFDTPYITFMLSGQEIPLSMAMQGYWTRFASTSDPNGNSAFMWPKYDMSGDQNITLDLTIAANAHLNQMHCDFWDKQLP
jgi:para-nitrobenzyl esterase